MARVVFGKQTQAERRAFGHAIRVARIRKGLRQEDLAPYVGCAKSRISFIETGKSTVSSEELATLERVLGRIRKRERCSLAEFGRTVRRQRVRAGRSVNEVAAELDIWADRLTRIELGQHKPRPSEKARLEKLLGVKLPEPEDYARIYPTKRSTTTKQRTGRRPAQRLRTSGSL